MFAIPCRGEIKSSVFLDLVGTILQGTAYWYRTHGEDAVVSFSVQPRAHVVAARNAAVEQALATRADWVMWLDDDMSPSAPHDLVEQLHRTGHDFVGAVAYKREPPYLPCVARIEEGKIVPFDPDITQATVRADLTGFGCVLTQRRVLEAVCARTEGRPFAWRGDAGIGEDFYFCLHAREAGVELYIVPGVEVGHATDLIVGRRQRLAYLDAQPTDGRPASGALTQPAA
jgi:GT2 family glycosyltransferase